MIEPLQRRPEEGNASTATMAAARGKANQKRKALMTLTVCAKHTPLDTRRRGLCKASVLDSDLRSKLLFRSDNNFRLADLRQKVFASADVFVHETRWGVGKPLA